MSPQGIHPTTSHTNTNTTSQPPLGSSSLQSPTSSHTHILTSSHPHRLLGAASWSRSQPPTLPLARIRSLIISPRAPSLLGHSVKLDSRETPPPLHFSPAVSDRDRSSTRETTPIGTPRGFGVGTGLPRKANQEKDLLPWNNRTTGFSANTSSYVDDALLESDYETSTFPLFDEAIGQDSMGSRATPRDIATSTRDPSRFNNSTNALHPTTGNEARLSGAMDINGGSSKGAMNSVYGRRDSVARSGAIPMNSSNRDRTRRESLAGSMVTGMSWGGNSVGSWIRDDIIMQGTSPFPQYQSPSARSFHSSSYVPKLEANFMSDFRCCGSTLPSLHDLLQHYEEFHAGAQGPPLSKQTSNHGPEERPDPKAAIAAGAAAAIVDPSKAQQQQNRVKQQSGSNTPQRSATPIQQRTTPPYSFATQAQPISTNHDDDTVGDMEMDDAPTPSADYSQMSYGMPDTTTMMQNYGFGGQPSASRVAPLELNTQFNQYRGLRESTPTTPVSAHRSTFNRFDPTVSSVNTPTMPTHSTHHPLAHASGYDFTPDTSAPGTPGELADDFVGNMNAMNAMNLGNNNMYPMNQFGGNFGYDPREMLELQCIDEPAKRLFSINGAFSNPLPGAQQQLNQQQLAQAEGSSGAPDSATQLGDGQYGENSEIARTIREEQKRAGVPDPSADGIPKPFHCPVIGCEKAYKNQNGLKYHKSHGHNAQALVQNGNGTFSIVDPETHLPYKGTEGMEKHKPYRCDVCGKRYKNLNGLKYHKSHSPACEDKDEAAAGPPSAQKKAT